MVTDDSATPTGAGVVARHVNDFYERHPYPPPVDDLVAYRQSWNDARRRAESHLYWPDKPYREDRSILVAGCGTVQAAHYALRWPRASITGIDVSATSLAFTQGLRQKYALDNLELQQRAVEHVAELGQTFDQVVCTGVLHHLADPNAALQALRDVLNPGGALTVMVYAPYGRAGIYMLQEYCRRLGIGNTDAELDGLAAALATLSPDHPLAPLLRKSPDFATKAGLADALLHPNDRSYSVPQLLDFLGRAGLTFGRWVRQAPYLPWCGTFASSPHHARLVELTPDAQYAALELFRGTMVRHSAIAYRSDAAPTAMPANFEGDDWLQCVPIRLPDTIAVRERLPAGAHAVLINRNHSYPDLFLPIDARQDVLFAAIDGTRTIAQIRGNHCSPEFARDFFQNLWRWDQIVVSS